MIQRESPTPKSSVWTFLPQSLLRQLSKLCHPHEASFSIALSVEIFLQQEHLLFSLLVTPCISLHRLFDHISGAGGFGSLKGTLAQGQQ